MPRAAPRLSVCERQQRFQVQRLRHRHQDGPVGASRPLGLGAVTVELDAVAIQVAEIYRLADPVIRHALQRNARVHHAPHHVREIAA